jgi:hypothetical protein
MRGMKRGRADPFCSHLSRFEVPSPGFAEVRD